MPAAWALAVGLPRITVVPMPLPLRRVRSIRRSHVSAGVAHEQGAVADFARPIERGATFKSWLESLPAVLGASDIRRVVRAITKARRGGHRFGVLERMSSRPVSPRC